MIYSVSDENYIVVLDHISRVTKVPHSGSSMIFEIAVMRQGATSLEILKYRDDTGREAMWEKLQSALSIR